MATQTKAVLENASVVLKAAGMTLRRRRQCAASTSTDNAAFQDMNKVYQTYFRTDPPARATVKGAADHRPTTSSRATMIAVKASNKTRVHDAER